MTMIMPVPSTRRAGSRHRGPTPCGWSRGTLARAGNRPRAQRRPARSPCRRGRGARIAMHVSRLPAKSRYLPRPRTCPAGSAPARRYSIARIFGAPETVPAGKHAVKASTGPNSSRRVPSTSLTMCITWEYRSILEAGNAHRPELRHAAHVVPAEVDEHAVLRQLLPHRGGGLARGRCPPPGSSPPPRARDGPHRHAAALHANHRLGRGAEEGRLSPLEVEEVRRWVERAQRPVDLEGIDGDFTLGKRCERTIWKASLPRCTGRADGGESRAESSRSCRPRWRRGSGRIGCGTSTLGRGRASASASSSIRRTAAAYASSSRAENPRRRRARLR